MSELRNLPAVDKLLQTEKASALVVEFGRPLTLDALRSALQSARANYQKGARVPGEVEILEWAEHFLKTRTAPTLRPVINASGVIIHTNLGRAPLSRAAIRAARSGKLGM